MLKMQKDYWFQDQAYQLLKKYEKVINRSKGVWKHSLGEDSSSKETWWFWKKISSLGEDCWVWRFCCSKNILSIMLMLELIILLPVLTFCCWIFCCWKSLTCCCWCIYSAAQVIRLYTHFVIIEKILSCVESHCKPIRTP